jgi:hypothetical protein
MPRIINTFENFEKEISYLKGNVFTTIGKAGKRRSGKTLYHVRVFANNS